MDVTLIIAAVNNVLMGCAPAMPTDTPSPMVTATPTHTPPNTSQSCASTPDGTTCDAGTDSAHILTCSGGACGLCAPDTNAAPRFVDNGNGTITDRLTCLVWEKKDDAGGLHDKDKFYAWCNDANNDSICDNGGAPDGGAFTVFLAGLNSAAFAGHRDWRLPKEEGSIGGLQNGSGPNELESILSAKGPGCPAVAPCVDAVFNTNCGTPHQVGCTVDGTGGKQECSCTRPGNYWSATTVDPLGPVPNKVAAWTVFFVGGGVNFTAKPALNNVRAVRGGL